MGGNLFNLGRRKREDYLSIEADMRAYLDQKFGDLYRIPRYYRLKPDFGDMDIVLSAKAITTTWQALKASITEDLQLKQTQSSRRDHQGGPGSDRPK